LKQTGDRDWKHLSGCDHDHQSKNRFSGEEALHAHPGRCDRETRGPELDKVFSILSRPLCWSGLKKRSAINIAWITDRFKKKTHPEND